MLVSTGKPDGGSLIRDVGHEAENRKDEKPMKLDVKSRMKKMDGPAPASPEIPPPVKGNGHGDFMPQTAEAPAAAKTTGGNGPSEPVGQTLPGAFEPSNEFYRVVRKETSRVFPDRAYIDSAALTNAGEQKVSEFHRNFFFSDEARSAKYQVLRQTIADVQDNIASGEAHEAQRESELNRTERDLFEDTKPQLWRTSTKWLVAGMFALAAIYVAAEVRNGMVFCLMSGRELLQNPLMALFISLVPCTAVGVFLELLSLQFQTDRARWLFKLVMGIVGLVAGVAAIPLFAATYAEFLRDPAEVMAHGSGSGFSPAVTIGLQIFLCSLAAAALVIFALAIIEKHRGPARQDNPSWLKIKKDLDEISRVLRKDRELLGFAQGKLDALMAELNMLVEKSATAYRLARQPWEVSEQRARQAASTLDQMLPRRTAKPNLEPPSQKP